MVPSDRSRDHGQSWGVFLLWEWLSSGTHCPKIVESPCLDTQKPSGHVLPGHLASDGPAWAGVGPDDLPEVLSNLSHSVILWIVKSRLKEADRTTWEWTRSSLVVGAYGKQLKPKKVSRRSQLEQLEILGHMYFFGMSLKRLNTDRGWNKEMSFSCMFGKILTGWTFQGMEEKI